MSCPHGLRNPSHPSSNECVSRNHGSKLMILVIAEQRSRSLVSSPMKPRIPMVRHRMLLVARLIELWSERVAQVVPCRAARCCPFGFESSPQGACVNYVSQVKQPLIEYTILVHRHFRNLLARQTRWPAGLVMSTHDDATAKEGNVLCG